RNNVVLRGLAFEHAANCFNTTSASVNSSNNVLVDSITAEWNNWGGFGVFGSNNVTVQYSLASYNGGVGFMGTRDQNLLFSSNESDYNNWRGAQGAFYDWAAGGTKFFQMRKTSVQNHLSYNNEAQGLWFDTDDQNITINQAALSGNVLAGLQIERNKGPITLQNSYLCNNGVGLNLLTSQKTTVQNNTFYNNGGTNTHQAQIFLGGNSGGIFIQDWLTGKFDNLVTTGTVLSGNVIEDNGAGQSVVGTYLNASDWAQFTSSLTSDYNQWYDPRSASTFNISGGKYVALSTWQSNYGTDQNSDWGPPAVSPAKACSAPWPAYPDFQVVLNNNTIYMTGGAGTATVNVRSFGYGPVTLWLRGLPWGVNAAFSQNNVASGMVTIRLSTSSSVGPQTVPVTLWAVSGSRVHTITFNLSVT
ncbi:MAG TPA: right-handed parallel beta-helix repeat-containing protein, partial [Terracidiphilus sp.]|nr:right-handed parallel beta-helix repeat-containing protein [Terracidiphilus sp.]